MESKDVFCKKCNSNVSFKVEEATLHANLKGEDISFQGKVLKSESCCHKSFDDEIVKLNTKALNDMYRIHHNLISLEKISDLPKKYDIGKRPLSLILGWGELTFTRYINGDIPSSSYSQILEKVYNYPTEFLKLLEENKNLISKKSYDKSRTTTINLIGKSSKTLELFNYIFANCEDITVSSAHKILYYAEGFHLAFFNETISDIAINLENSTPVYAEIPTKSEILNLGLDIANLSETEQLIFDNILKYFACYSGMILTKFTQNELPCIGKTDSLDKAILSDYFKSIISRYSMISPIDINLYAKNMFDLVQ